MNTKCESVTGLFGKPIHTYTRAQAIADGYLVDVTETGREAGFRFPVALTRAAWDDCVTWSDDDTSRKHWAQDEAGRLWDVVYLARFACKRAAQGSGDRAQFQIYRVPRDGRGIKARPVTLIAHVGPGDAGEPVITIGLPQDF